MDDAPILSRRAFERVAWATLPLPCLAAYALGPPAATWVPGDSEVASLLTLLVYVLVLLGCVLVWGVLLLPLRRRAGITPIREELVEMRAAGGFLRAMTRERRALEARAARDDPGYHATFALVGLLCAATAGALTWALWNDGYLMYVVVAAAVVCPLLTAYHAVQWLRFR